VGEKRRQEVAGLGVKKTYVIKSQRNRVFFFMSVLLGTEGKVSSRVKVKKGCPYASLVTTPRK
jgi:hypothetical protein